MSKFIAFTAIATLAIALATTAAPAHPIDPGAWTTATTVASAKADKLQLLAAKPDCKSRKGKSNPCS
jgi:hypothetical protein